MNDATCERFFNHYKQLKSNVQNNFRYLFVGLGEVVEGGGGELVCHGHGLIPIFNGSYVKILSLNLEIDKNYTIICHILTDCFAIWQSIDIPAGPDCVAELGVRLVPRAHPLLEAPHAAGGRGLEGRRRDQVVALQLAAREGKGVSRKKT